MNTQNIKSTYTILNPLSKYFIHVENIRFMPMTLRGAWEQPPRGAPGYQVLLDILFRLGLIANCSHTVQYLDCIATLIEVAIIITCFGTVWPFWCWCAVKLWYHHHHNGGDNDGRHMNSNTRRKLALNKTGQHIVSHTVEYTINIPWKYSWFVPYILFPGRKLQCIYLHDAYNCNQSFCLRHSGFQWNSTLPLWQTGSVITP